MICPTQSVACRCSPTTRAESRLAIAGRSHPRSRRNCRYARFRWCMMARGRWSASSLGGVMGRRRMRRHVLVALDRARGVARFDRSHNWRSQSISPLGGALWTARIESQVCRRPSGARRADAVRQKAACQARCAAEHVVECAAARLQMASRSTRASQTVAGVCQASAARGDLANANAPPMRSDRRRADPPLAAWLACGRRCSDVP